MKAPKRYLAVIAYLVPVLGWLYILLFQKEEKFAVYHAKQSLVLTITAVLAPVTWAVVAWILALVPLVGPVTAVSVFALVILVYIALAVIWVIGMIYALRAKMKPLPVFGGWAEKMRSRSIINSIYPMKKRSARLPSVRTANGFPRLIKGERFACGKPAHGKKCREWHTMIP